MALAGLLAAVNAEDGDSFDLPDALYILLNEGRVERYGVGAGGVSEVTPEDAFVIDFGVAPDGRWLAFRTQDGLYVQDMARADDIPTRLDDAATASFPPYRRGGQTIAWSPRGGVIAYTTEFGARVVTGLTSNEAGFTNIAVSPLEHLEWSTDGLFLAARADDNVWWIYRRDGREMVLAGALPSSVGAAWLDNTRLIFAPENGGLYLIDFADQNRQIEIQAPPRLYRLPAVRADGEIAVFTRLSGQDDIAEDEAFLRRLTLDDERGTIIDTAEVAIDLRGQTWAPRGELLIAFRDSGLALTNPQTGANLPLPTAQAVAFGWGNKRGEPSTTLNVDGFVLGDDVLGVTQIWRITPEAAPQMLTDGFEDVVAYAVSRDRRRMAYIAEGALWAVDMSAGDFAPRQLFAVADDAGGLTFDAAGDALFYHSEGGLWRGEWAGESGEPSLVLPPDGRASYRNPHYAPNVNAMLIQVVDDNEQIAFYDVVSGALIRLGAYDGATWLSDGRVIAWRNVADSAEAYLIDPNSNPPNMARLLRLESEHIEAVRQVDLVNIRLVTSIAGARAPTFMRIINTPITGADVSTIDVLPALIDTVLSPDGERAVGGAGFNRLLYDSATEQTLEMPVNTRRFTWASP
ncbi:MAG: hypothetical protein EA396_04930 [Anaerolineaceae bacterium]|nr:MAG: hypothetical protein EA396_04930 [Anaerolineaceae bacterium]